MGDRLPVVVVRGGEEEIRAVRLSTELSPHLHGEADVRGRHALDGGGGVGGGVVHPRLHVGLAWGHIVRQGTWGRGHLPGVPREVLEELLGEVKVPQPTLIGVPWPRHSAGVDANSAGWGRELQVIVVERAGGRVVVV